MSPQRYANKKERTNIRSHLVKSCSEEDKSSLGDERQVIFSLLNKKNFLPYSFYLLFFISLQAEQVFQQL